MVVKLFHFTRMLGKLCHKTAIAASSVFSIYAITIGSDNLVRHFPSLIINAQAQETNSKDTGAKETNDCSINKETITKLKQSAHGFFKNMRFADTAYDTRNFTFKDSEGNDHSLKEFSGKVLLVNLWASWCIPCRTEMPELANLKRNIGGDNFDVIAINIDKTATDEKIRNFLQSIKADNIVFYRDQTMTIFNDVRKQGLALGLPITMLIDRNGCILASYNGSAPWSNVDSETLMKTALDAGKTD
ncbi:TlpA disulfide reductase family protein [uncultured Bartonella sp.]|uniref:TlpA disulfide reductase family protein n=1 Tax=uncultured Bartonella sp. TaxID=104108 RepID=UPI0026309C98|nr:TlpA disulfide reductase family protein [uncultured Bartonella sp.]